MPSILLRKRARDLDRVQVCGALDSAYAEGQLDGEEYRTRTAAAMSGRTIGELRALVQDLQVPPDLRMTAGSGVPAATPPPRLLSERTRAHARSLVVALAVLPVLVGVHAVVNGPADPPPPPPPAAADVPLAVPPVALHSPEGFRGFVEAVRGEFGTTQVAGAIVHADFADVQVVEPGAPGRTRTYTYRGGFGEQVTAGSRPADEPLVDLAAYDTDAVLALAAGAGERVGVENAGRVQLTFRDIGDGPEVVVEAANEFWETGRIEARADGSVIAVHPFAPR